MFWTGFIFGGLFCGSIVCFLSFVVDFTNKVKERKKSLENPVFKKPYTGGHIF